MDKHRIKIDELKKDNVFKVPEGYFEDLPSVIQSRVAQPARNERSWVAQPMVRWATVAASVLVFVVYVTLFRSNVDTASAEILIAQIETEDLIAYLEYSDMTTEELITDYGLENIYIDDLEAESLFLEDIEIDELESLDLLESIDDVSQELL